MLTQKPGGGLSLVVKNKSASDGQVETGHPQTSTENAIAQRSERMVLLEKGTEKMFSATWLVEASTVWVPPPSRKIHQ